MNTGRRFSITSKAQSISWGCSSISAIIPKQLLKELSYKPKFFYDFPSIRAKNDGFFFFSCRSCVSWFNFLVSN